MSDRKMDVAGWCILRTAGPRTLSLTEWLNAAGIEAWTPTRLVKRRAMRGKRASEKLPVPLTPTFVFARWEALDRLRALLRDPMSSHPAFSLFRYHGAVPEIADREIERLRAAERKLTPAALRKTWPAGAVMKPAEGAYAGMEGVVVTSNGRVTLVAFGGWMDVKFETFAIRSDEIREVKPVMGGAA